MYNFLRFFMDLSGNKSLLDRELVAFFASRNAPAQAVALARKWACEIAQTDKVVISGFHSPIEREVFSVLQAHSRPVIVAPNAIAIGRPIMPVPPLMSRVISRSCCPRASIKSLLTLLVTRE